MGVPGGPAVTVDCCFQARDATAGPRHTQNCSSLARCRTCVHCSRKTTGTPCVFQPLYQTTVQQQPWGCPAALTKLDATTCANKDRSHSCLGLAAAPDHSKHILRQHAHHSRCLGHASAVNRQPPRAVQHPCAPLSRSPGACCQSRAHTWPCACSTGAQSPAQTQREARPHVQ